MDMCPVLPEVSAPSFRVWLSPSRYVTPQPSWLYSECRDGLYTEVGVGVSIPLATSWFFFFSLFNSL